MFHESTDAVSLLWDESRNRLHSFIERRVRNDADADDILQDVFVKIHQNIGELKDPAKIYPWVFKTTRNAIADHYRANKADFSVLDEASDAYAFVPEDPSVEDEVLNWLEPMIAELPAKYREALMLADIKGLTQKEVSEKLAISVSGAKSRVQRGREKLKDILVDCCLLEFGRSGKIVEYRQQKDDCVGCAN
jgi:RNA polymerase sigma-70 factor (ECF subfamily)